MTQKRKYEKPSQRVIVLQQQAHLLDGSPNGLLSEPENYLPGEDPFGF